MESGENFRVEAWKKEKLRLGRRISEGFTERVRTSEPGARYMVVSATVQYKYCTVYCTVGS